MRPGGAPQAHLSCRSKAAVRQGRSSSAWSTSTAVVASSRDGRSATNSAVRAGLFQARNCRGRGRLSGTGRCGGFAAEGGSRPGPHAAATRVLPQAGASAAAPTFYCAVTQGSENTPFAYFIALFSLLLCSLLYQQLKHFHFAAAFCSN